MAALLAAASFGAPRDEFDSLVDQAVAVIDRDKAIPLLDRAGAIADKFSEEDPRRLRLVVALSRWSFHSFKDHQEQETRLHRYQDSLFAYREKLLAAAPDPKSAILDIRHACSNAVYHDRAAQSCDCLSALIPDFVRLFGAASNETAKTHSALARALDAADQPDRAAASLATAASIAKGESLAEILEQSASREKNREAARPIYDQALSVREEALGEASPEFSEALGRVANDLEDDPEYAEKLHRRRIGLEAKHRTGSLTHARALVGLADLLVNEERNPDEADRLYTGGIGLLRQRMAGPNIIAFALERHSRLASSRRQYTEAVSLAEESLAIRRTIAGGPGAGTDHALRWLAEVCARGGRHAESEKYFGEFAQWARMKEPAQLITLADTLGELYEEQGDWARAAPKYEVAAATQEAVEPSDTFELAQRITKLARVYQAMGKHTEATRLNTRVLGLYFSTMGNSGATVWRTILAVTGFMMLFPMFVFGVLQFYCARAVDNGLARLYLPVPAPPAPGAFPEQSADPVAASAVMEAAEAPETVEMPAVEPAPDPQPLPPAPAARHQAVFHGDGSTLFSIRIVNLLLSILTLGTYFFWGKARVRRYVYGQTEYLGDRFAFLGHGREMLVGWVKSLPALAFVLFFPNILPLVWQSIHSLWVAQLAATAVFLVLWPVARVGAYRYRMNRTAWRGVRFSFRGDSQPYFQFTLKGYLLSSLTLGLYMPVLGIHQRRYIMNHTYFGDARFGFDGRGRDLVPSFFMALPLTFASFGLYWAWWAALRARYEWAHTTFGEARFACNATGGSLLRLWLGNLALLLFTLGLAMPWTIARTARYWTERVELTGPVDLAAIRQSAHGASAVGESFADFLGFDFGI